mgnify:CR=1 FL=1
MWGNIAIAFILAFVVTFVTTPYTMKIAKKIGAIDIPKDERRAHKRSIPKFGGPAVIIGFLVSTIYLLIVMSAEKSINLFGVQEYWKKLLGFLAGILIISGFCIVDDTKTIRPITKLIGQILGAICIVASGIRIEGISLPFLNFPEMHEITSILITLAWIIIVTNAINLIDGLDGLSSGISIISAISLLVIFVLNGSSLISIVLITALAGALVGFLPFNFTPAKTFLGDTGSNFLGFSLAVISILGSAKTYTAAVIVLPIIVLGLPIFDTIWAIFRRIIKEKSFKAVFKADKGHLHHRIVRRGFSTKQAVYILYGISACCGMFAVILLESGIWKAISFAIMVVLIVAVGLKNFIKPDREPGSQYECLNCRYIYNPKVGNQVAGIKPHTEFSDLPDDWTCPVCGKNKDNFKVHDG